MLSRPTFDVDGTSGDIDRRVREKLRAGQPLYQVDEAALTALAPDVVITQTHCEVCAVGPDALAGSAAHAAPALRRQRVATFQGGTLDGVLADFERVAAVIDRAEAGATAGRRPARPPGALAHRDRRPAPPPGGLPGVDRPAVRHGQLGPGAGDAGRGRRRPGDAPASTPGPSTGRTCVAADPDVLVIAPCGFALRPRPGATCRRWPARPGWSDLRAVRAGRAFVADGNLYFNRSGPSLFATIDRLAEMLHPERFGHSRHGRDYEKMRRRLSVRGRGAVESGRYGKRKVARPRSRRSRARAASAGRPRRRDR